MLRVENVNAYYGKSHILFDVAIEVRDAEVVALVGRNGVGKTTLLRTVMGLMSNRSGSIRFNEQEIMTLSAHKLAGLGLSLVPQEQSVFADFSVRDNLRVASPSGELDPDMGTSLMKNFPQLDERMNQMAGTLSGGERQMLAMARAFVKNPQLMLLDEPTEGLMPSAVEAVENSVRSFREGGMGILLVEQNLSTVLEVSDRVYVMEKGQIVHEEPVTPASGSSLEKFMGLEE